MRTGGRLYLFTHDSVGTSACAGSCESTWPSFEGKPTADSWYVVNAQGDKVEPGAGGTETPSTTASTGGGGY